MNNNEPLIKAEKVSKKFCKSFKRSLWYGVQDSCRELSGQSEYSHDLRKNEFWALKNVSFELRRGECLGLIGANGAGKSTLLKLLSGLIKPDSGRIEVRGRLDALIELGAGFSPVLSGRENIYINGAVLGFTKKDIDRKIDSIIEFSELGDFLDMPVKNYSSGMYVRLGFAIAAHLQPDILLIDEILAVGDIGFRSKCYGKIAELLKTCAVIFVSHSMPQIDRYCNKTLLLSNGRILANDETKNVIRKYYSLFKSEAKAVTELGENKLISFRLFDMDRKEIKTITHGSTLNIEIELTIDKKIKHPLIQLAFLNRELQIIAISKTKPLSIINDDSDKLLIQVAVFPFILNTGNYKISLLVFDEKEHQHLIWHNAAWDIEVTGNILNYASAGVYFDAEWQQNKK